MNKKESFLILQFEDNIKKIDLLDQKISLLNKLLIIVWILMLFISIFK